MSEEVYEPQEIEHAPPRMSQVIAVIAALLGTLLTVPFAIFAIPFGIAGFVAIAVGLFYTHSRAWLTTGTGLVLCGALVTGAYGGIPPALMLVGIGAMIIGWDVGQHGIVIGKQLGRTTRSQRNQLIHTATTVLVVAVISTGAYVSYLFAGGGRPAAAVAVVVLGVVVVAWVFRS